MDAFSIAQEDVNRFVASLSFPDEAHVAVANVESVIRVVFAASLQTNEHRPCRFRVAWVQPERAAVLLRFEVPVPLEVGQMRRLAAASSQGSVIGVFGEHVWGLGHRGSHCRFYVDAVGPGCLKLGGWSLTPSLVIEPDGATFVGTPALPMSMIASLIRRDHVIQQRRFMIGQAIASVLLEMRRLGHGGTLIVLGRGWTDFAAHFSSWEQGLPPSTDVSALIDSIREPNPSWRDVPALRQQFAAAARVQLEGMLKTYAELSLMDGALVVDADLSLLGVGAKLSATGAPQVECTWPSDPPRTETIDLATLGGTRHQSAARFVAMHGDALAFVVSADGPTTAFVPIGSSDRVAAIRRFDWIL